MPGRRVIVISPRKSGTHLIQRLLTGLGYGVWGDLGAPASDLVRLSVRERLDVARLVMPETAVAELDYRQHRADFIRVTNRAWADLARIWSFRLGTAAMRPYWPLQQPGAVSSPAWTGPFSTTPPGVAWIYHRLDLAAADPAFLFEWHDTGEPAIILNVRDPRDALVSLVAFLAGEARHGSLLTPDSQVHGPAMAALPDMKARLAYAIRDPTLAFYEDYRSAIPLFAHPGVCRVSFEELVGPSGGGDPGRQAAAVERVAEFLRVTDRDPGAVARSLYDTGSFTFRAGQAGTWRAEFSAHLEEQFAQRHGDLLTGLGYT
ncbi:MAG TPA: hypothetical protein VK817_03445 [Trebonia sp.]|jgi:hypothetical protein|nr:hypothetical protein [Trebonia sp.]